MIIVCEPICVGFEHALVNSALLAVIKLSFPFERILFLADSSHLESVREIVDAYDIGPFEYMAVNCPKNKSTYIDRISGDWALAEEAFTVAEDLNADRLLFSSVESSGLWCIKILIRRHKKIKATVVVHSILETVMERPSFKPRDLPFWFRYSLALFNLSRLRYILLGKSIENHLKRILPHVQKFVYSIDLPYFYKENPKINTLSNKSILFGAFGVGNKSKGTDLFFKLAGHVSQQNQIGTAEFVLIGHITDSSLNELRSKEVIIPSDLPLDRLVFDKLASEIDYSVFCYPLHSYQLTASGAFFDALSFVKPIISLRNPFFEYYFQKMGDIGYLCDSYDEMENLIVEIIANRPTERYKQQCTNILAGRELLSVSNIAKQFKQVLES